MHVARATGCGNPAHGVAGGGGALRLPSGCCYTSASSSGSCPPVPKIQVHRVLNSMDAGRRLAKRAIAAQAIATLVLALALLLLGPAHALGALFGGGGLALGNAAMAWLGLRSDAPAAGFAMGQLLIGLLVKWVLVVLVLAVGVLILNLPGPAVLAGLLVSMVVFFAVGSRVRH